MEGEILYVVCYDIQKDSARERVSTLLGEHLVRVQKSVFEGRMTERQCARLMRKAALLIGEDDSLRAYGVSATGLKRSLAYGPQPLPEPQDFYLL